MYQEKDNHAKNCAKAYMEEIIRLLSIRERCVKHDHFKWVDDIDQKLREMPLSVLVRGPWRVPGTPGDDSGEYQILLATGGPAVRVVGEMEEYGGAISAKMQYQDWGTPWTDLDDQEESILIAFADYFYLEG
jgi:hypothetical protein